MIRLRKLFYFPYLPIWSGAFILLAPVYLSLKAIFWGAPVLQFAPWWSTAWRTLLSGHLPLWNPLSGMGAPLLANYQSGLLYPPYWIYLLLYAVGGDRLMAWGMAPLAALHLVWAGLGMVFLTRRLGLKDLAQAISGLAFCLSGYLVTRLGFLSINAACAWLPWILFLLTPVDINDRSRVKGFPWLVICLAMLLLAGHAQTAWYTLLLATIWSAFWVWNSSDDFEVSQKKVSGPSLQSNIRKLGHTWLALGLCFALAAGISAAQLLPTAEFLVQSQRASAVEYSYAMNYSFWPWHLLNLLSPIVFGSPATGDYWLYSSYWEDAVYIGLLPLLLAISAIIGSFKRTQADNRCRKLIWLLIGIFLIAFVLALGSNTPVFPWLYRHIPTFSMFQAPARWMIWAEFALALLAGFGADRWRRPQAWGLYLTRLGTMGAVAVSIGTGLTWLCLGGVSPSFIKSAAIIGALGVGAGLLSLSAPLDATVRQKSENEYPCENSSKRNRLIQLKPPKSGIPLPGKYYSQTRWQWAVVIWIMVDLLAAGWGLNPGVDLNIYGPTPGTDQMKSMLAGKRLYLNSVQEDWLKYVRFMRFNTFEIGEDWLNLRRVFLPDTNLLDEIPSTSNYDPLVPGRFAEWKELLLEVSPETYLDLLRLMGVGAVESLDRRIQSGVSFAPLDGERVRIVNCAIPAKDGAEAEELMSGGQIDFDRQVVVENLLASVNTCNQKSVEGIVNEVIIIKAWDDGPNIKHFETKSNGSGWLVISDTWYPGWRSWIDGQPVPLYRANFLFMALELPKGDHKIEIKYQPLSLYLGAGISLISLLLFGFVLKWKRRRLSG